MADVRFSFSKKWPHILLLIAALVILNLWANEHLAFSTPVLLSAGVFSVIISVISFLREYLNDDEESKIKSAVRWLIDTCLNRSVLVGLYIFIALILLFVSSFTIYKADFDERPSIRSASAKESLQACEYVEVREEQQSFPKLIWPWGRECSAEVSTYGVHTFKIYPLFSAEPKFSKSPKFFVGLVGGVPMYAGTSLAIIHNQQTIKVERGDTLSIVIGRTNEISPAEMEDLKEFLNIQVQQPEYVAQAMAGWTSSLALPLSIKPGDTLEVKLIRPDGTEFQTTGKKIVSKKPSFQFALL
jgi:hypothetical protein